MIGSGQLIATPALAAATIAEPTRTSLPILWADDAHDDAEALTALLSGQPVQRAVTGEALQAPREQGWIVLRGGTYLVDGPVKPTTPFMLLCATVRQAPYRHESAGVIFDLSAMPPLRPGEATNAIFRHCRLRAATEETAADFVDFSS